MTQDRALKTNTRDIDANVLQNKASNPKASVWVGASAGSGKTKVLTDRILKLLLSDEHGQQACAPHKILALTFTKAAASEMSLRINSRLSEWATMDLDGEKGLISSLQNLLGYIPTETQIESARQLFAQVIDVPGGLKIMTIHSFCQAILGRFSLEADIVPGFKPLEENQAKEFIQKAKQRVFTIAKEEKASPLSNALNNIILAQNEEQFDLLLTNIMSERRQFKKILEKNFGIDGLYTALCNALDVPAGKNEEQYLLQACADDQFDKGGLWDAVKALSTGKKTDIENSEKIQSWLELDQTQRLINVNEYMSVYLTNENTIRSTSRFPTKTIKDNFPDTVDVLTTEAHRILHLKEQLKSIRITNMTRDLFLIADYVLNEYQRLKEKSNALDFDDLIIRTLDLLTGNTPSMKHLDVALDVSPWIRYKLDQGIDHILVDEAQDTNPEQWQIIQALSDDFFDNQEDDINRTLFVVGDQKQSIFSFQRASPEKFQEMQVWFEEKILNAQKDFDRINFNVSFRSVNAVLDLVDNIFTDPALRKGLDDEQIEHKAFRYTQAGHVELWPIFKPEEKQDIDPWTPPINITESSSGAAKMADHIGQKIAEWLDNKEFLKSHDRPIEAGDIMILLRSRNAFVDQLVRALKTRNVPVSGVDRMILNEQLPVQDLCAVAQFGLLPEDDLNLACLLKSPLIGWSEDDLFNACYDRKRKSLWQNIKDNNNDDLVTWLENIIQYAGIQKPYEFFSGVLNTPCPANNISGLSAIKKRLGDESLDPIYEFLNSTLAFEKENIATLQNFLQDHLNNQSQIKREMEEAGTAVRIMTVHGAKGLQAPIVILPDTVRTSSSVKPTRILWPHKTNDALPYFYPKSDDLPNVLHPLSDAIKEKDDEEYRRLLYVALTRAEERLYIGGYQGKKAPLPNCWYNYIKQGFDNFSDLETIEENGLEIKRYTNPATDKPDKSKTAETQSVQEISDAPSWLFAPIKEEPFPPRPLRPSRPSESDSPALSPLQSSHEYRFLRGNIIHKLLQILPDLPQENRAQAAQKYVCQPAHGLDDNVQNEIIEETLHILENEEFSEIFGQDSLAEVPVTGLMGNRIISGQIDRLLVTEDTVYIIDYKTNRPPPSDEKDVPLIYKNQMQAYADVMRKIYPKREIKCALVWTNNATLMPITV